MELTPENQAAIQQWNTLGFEISGNSLNSAVTPWFRNIRALIDRINTPSFPFHSIMEAVKRLSRKKYIVVLGSGPSITDVCRRLPLDRSRYAIICGASAIGALAREGLAPDVLMLADSSPVLYEMVKQSDIRDGFDIILPITADPAWYSRESVFSPERLFFYKNYQDDMGSIETPYNHILDALFDGFKGFLTMAGSVSNAALNVAQWACGGDSEKHIYIGVDCSWPKGGPYHAPLRFSSERYTQEIRDWENAKRNDSIDIEVNDERVESDLVHIGYMVQMLYTIHTWWLNDSASKDRFSFFSNSAKLIRATSPELKFPYVLPDQVSYNAPLFPEKDWAYTAMLGLIRLHNTLQDRLRNTLVEMCLADWRKNHQVVNIVDIFPSEFPVIAARIRAAEPDIKLQFNGVNA